VPLKGPNFKMNKLNIYSKNSIFDLKTAILFFLPILFDVLLVVARGALGAL
jgi:hypothetical protein